jgi:hypothetical protein
VCTPPLIGSLKMPVKRVSRAPLATVSARLQGINEVVEPLAQRSKSGPTIDQWSYLPKRPTSMMSINVCGEFAADVFAYALAQRRHMRLRSF